MTNGCPEEEAGKDVCHGPDPDPKDLSDALCFSCLLQQTSNLGGGRSNIGARPEGSGR